MWSGHAPHRAGCRSGRSGRRQGGHRRQRRPAGSRGVGQQTGRPLDEVTADVGRDRWFDAEAARDYGFVDHIVTSLDDVRPTLPTRRIGLAGPAPLAAQITTGAAR